MQTMNIAEEQALKAYPRTDDAWGDEWQKRVGFVEGYNQAEKDLTDKAKFSSGWDGFYYGQGYKQALKDIWHNVKDETPMDGERLLLINRNGEYGTTMLMMPILYKEFRNWEKWAYIKDLIPSE